MLQDVTHKDHVKTLLRKSLYPFRRVQVARQNFITELSCLCGSHRIDLDPHN
jgi:hypothetical protein